jgi:hypothetical protein
VSGVLVDSSVLIDLSSGAAPWGSWSTRTIMDLVDQGEVLWINQIIYAESLLSFRRMADSRLDDGVLFEHLDLPWEAAERAAEVQAAYRLRGGSREAVLPDFLIGAHAEVAGLSLLTRDPRRVRSEFPSVRIISPTA